MPSKVAGGGAGRQGAGRHAQRVAEQLARLADLGIGAAEARPFCDGVTDVEVLVDLVMEARDRSVGIPGLPAIVATEVDEGGGRGNSTATASKACVIL